MIRQGTVLALAVAVVAMYGSSALMFSGMAKAVDCNADKSTWTAAEWNICSEKEKIKLKEGYKSVPLSPPSKPNYYSSPDTGGTKALKNLKEFEQQIQLEKLDKVK